MVVVVKRNTGSVCHEIPAESEPGVEPVERCGLGNRIGSECEDMSLGNLLDRMLAVAPAVDKPVDLKIGGLALVDVAPKSPGLERDVDHMHANFGR